MTDRNIPGIDDHTGREVIRSSSVRPVSEWKPPTLGPFVPPAERGLGLYQSRHRAPGPMTKTEALQWKARVGEQAKTLRTILKEGYDRKAWIALGFTDWTHCLQSLANEFGLSERHMWRLHSANETQKLLTNWSVEEIPEGQLREIAKLDDPDQVLAWKTVVETAVATGGKVTAGYVKEVAETLKEIRDTGHLTYGEEAALPASEIVQAKLTEAARELMLRRQEYIKQGRKDKREGRLENIRIASNLNELQKLYPVFYADPPWRYEHSKTHSRDIENQYPTMTLEEICDLPVADISTEHAILFLWATAPKLEEAMQVIKAWGFTYRTCMVWDKELMGMGYWTRVQHELLLIAVKGDFPVPEEENRVRSVYRENRGEHSTKPDYYRDLIERMYPDISRLELFARTADRPDRWDVWGNEVEQLQ